MVWSDRFTGRVVKELPESIESSRYLASGFVCINGHTGLSDGGLLVDDGSGRFLSPGAEHEFYVADVDQAQDVQGDVVVSALKEFVSATEDGRKRSFLLPEKLLGWLHLTELDEAILHVVEKGHFHEIVRAPKLDLVYQEHLLPVGRVKRIPSSATRHLAAHSECWQKRSFSGVVPKTLLALESEDEFNIYENRVFARLLDHLERYLQRRCSEVSCIEEALEERDKLDASDVYWETNRAICSLWGEGFSDSVVEGDEAEQGRDTLRILTRLLKTIRGLRESKLYKEIPHKDDVGFQIRLTNTLSHDQHYRHVARLWHKWNEYSKLDRVDPERVFEQNQSIAKAYCTYCYELVYRALRELGFSGEDGRFFDNDICEIQYTIEHGNIALCMAGRSLTFIPLMNDFTSESVSEANSSRVILTPQAWPFELPFNVQTASPLFFYTLEAIVSRISSWIVQIDIDAAQKKLEKIPSRVQNLLVSNYKDYFSILGHEGRLRLPLSGIREVLISELTEKSEDHSIRQFISQLSSRAEAMERLLRCPSCGVKSEVVQYVDRGRDGFEIRSSQCNHEWRIDRDASGRRYLVVLPQQQDECGVTPEESFLRYGRYMWRVSL